MSVTFGLDIGSTSMKASQITKSGNSFILQSIAVIPASTKGLVSESLSDQQELAGSIRKMLDDANLKSQFVNISIPDNLAYTKVIIMPELSDQELTAALRFEIEQYIPLPLDQVRTDWQVLGKSEENGKKMMNVMIVAAPLVMLEKYEKIITMIGLVPQAIETEIISVHRALFPIVVSTSPSLIIHIGSSTTNVAIVNNGIIGSVFTISLGGAAITRAISEDLGIDTNQAENYKKAYGLSQDAFEGKVGKALIPILDSISSEINKVILSFKQKTNLGIQQIVLSGGSALLPGIDAYFTNVFGIQVVVGNAFDAYTISNVPDELRADSPSYNVVMGLALRDYV